MLVSSAHQNAQINCLVLNSVKLHNIRRYMGQSPKVSGHPVVPLQAEQFTPSHGSQRLPVCLHDTTRLPHDGIRLNFILGVLNES
jgi:hypothetical protein